MLTKRPGDFQEGVWATLTISDREPAFRYDSQRKPLSSCPHRFLFKVLDFNANTPSAAGPEPEPF